MFQGGNIIGGKIGDLGRNAHLTQRTPTWGLQGLIIQMPTRDHGRNPTIGGKMHLLGRDAKGHDKLSKKSSQEEVEPPTRGALEERDMNTEGQKVP